MLFIIMVVDVGMGYPHIYTMMAINPIIHRNYPRNPDIPMGKCELGVVSMNNRVYSHHSINMRMTR